MKHSIDYSLYLVTDTDLCTLNSIERAVENAILGGVTVVQVREKTASSLELYNLSMKIKAITDKYNIPIIINDRLDIALSIDAAGLHIGQDDIPTHIARRLLGEGKILGVSARNIDEAMRAKNDGADYLGVGAVFNTTTKLDAKNTGLELLTEVKLSVNLPIVAIGGINKTNVHLVKGIDGIAVVSAIIGQPDETQAARELLSLITPY